MNYPTIVNGIDFRDLIFVANNDPVTDSFMVAKAFGKLPKNVVRDLERTIE
ncbi:Rha family transcriptional regulator, partial [Escherichia coli O43]|nr:Rha family transcriptional regulator [Escherichia coli O43]